MRVQTGHDKQRLSICGLTRFYGSNRCTGRHHTVVFASSGAVRAVSWLNVGVRLLDMGIVGAITFLENTEGVTIILLNGTSSAGKTTIAKALQQVMDAPYLHVPIDSFEDMMPERQKLGEPGSPLWQSVFNRMLSGFHHSLAALANTGSNLIVDHLLIQGIEPQNWLTECLDLLAPFTVYFVGVHCPLEELRRREQARGDRGIGLAEFQLSRVHRHGIYDLEVDTTVLSAAQCALKIKELVERDAHPEALITLRQRRETV